MKYLVDTHAFLWLVFDDPRISDRAVALLEDPNNELWMSFASIWEMSIKHSLGKLKFDQPFEEFVTEHVLGTQLDLLPIQMSHLLEVNQLPWHHRDPFDRILAAQCKAEGFTLISNDRAFEGYGLDFVW